MLDPRFVQLGLLALECALIAGVVVGLFRMRSRMGLGPLYVFLGSNQYLQTILAANIFIEVPGGTLVSPGSISLFGGSLFALLLVYVKESTQTTRNLIFGVVLANLTLTALSVITSFQVSFDGARNIGSIPVEIFQLNTRIFMSGTAVLVLDCLLLVVGHEALNRLKSIPLVARLWLIMAGVLAFDTVLFNFLSFGPGVLSTLSAQVLWKCAAATLYALLLALALAGPDSEESRGVWSIMRWQAQIDQLEAEHHDALRAVQRRASARDEFVAMMNHDIRTPLTSLKGSLRLLAQGAVSPEEGEALLDVGSRNVERLIRLTSDLLDLQKVESKSMPPRVEPLNALEACQTAAGGMNGLAQSHHVSLSISGEPCWVRADADKLQQVLQNLLSNAIRHSAPDARVELRVATLPDQVSIQCIDQGEGISEEDQHRIFDPFAQGPLSKQGGTGLGLAIVRALTAEMGGWVSVQSEIGHGATFQILLPRQPETEAS